VKGYDEKWLREQGLVQQEDGTYKKKKQGNSNSKRNPIKSEKANAITSDPSQKDGIEIRLFGIPLPKQSARMGKHGVYQPQKYKDRIKDYQSQMISQLPEGFEMFENQVIIEEMTFVFPALKKFNKSQMDIINGGEFIPKTTRPDLPDNLKKLPLDAMSGIIYKDDSVIWKECLTRKVYGTGGMIIVKLKGN
jgi:Holliday junction resolvase RusA-like endonuclease